MSLLSGLLEDVSLCDHFADAWLRRFRALGDRALRRRALLEIVHTSDDSTLLATLHRLEARAEGGEGDARWILSELAVAPGVLGELPYERLAELYAAARDVGLMRVAARFIGGTHLPKDAEEAAERRALLRAALGEEEASAAEAPTSNPHFEAAPGVRVAAARGTDRGALDRLLHDRDPRVVRALLDNPRIVERDVVRVAAMRPTSREILEAIAAHPRWAARALVRRAVACNPHAPHALARQLLPTLLRQDLALIVGSHVLSEALRREAQLLLTRRARRG